jgi:23S rRNA (uracil1939-C5)-methyltransferase
MIDRQNLNLTIEHIDPLGQGVAKNGNEIFFVPKTLPGEKVKVRILNKSKGVHFCEVEKILEPAPNRIKAACPHYEICRGCHLMHTDYESEINYKLSTIHRSLAKLVDAPIEIKTVRASERTHYRNRVQLHYSAKYNLIGFHDPRGKIIPINNCLVAEDAIQTYLKNFIPNWKEFIPKHEPPLGHVEISLQNGTVSCHWNKSYALDGFSQVNQEINQAMQNKISEIAQSKFNRPISVLDLFSGNGNLSNKLNFFKRWMIDCHNYQHNDFYQGNLFEINELARLKEKLPQTVDVIIVDPPRQGFEHISQWIESVRANYLVYVSCHHQTMVRDLVKIKKSFQIQEVILFDMFPSTYHFECMCIVKLS